MWASQVSGRVSRDQLRGTHAHRTRALARRVFPERSSLGSQRGEVARQGDAHAGASWGTRAAAPAPSESSGGTPRSTWRPRGRAGQFESFESAHARPEPRDASPSANGDQAPVRQPQGTDGEVSGELRSPVYADACSPRACCKATRKLAWNRRKTIGTPQPAYLIAL